MPQLQLPKVTTDYYFQHNYVELADLSVTNVVGELQRRSLALTGDCGTIEAPDSNYPVHKKK